MLVQLQFKYLFGRLTPVKSCTLNKVKETAWPRRLTQASHQPRSRLLSESLCRLKDLTGAMTEVQLKKQMLFGNLLRSEFGTPLLIPNKHMRVGDIGYFLGAQLF